uniref:11S globulin seed storage protein Ana o 2.0101-like n=1 Tax=Erigeron canadensis TaxID=72917 RepID=UPI001CB88CD7|nr:11S globulin seed storage protein Ana o 2.0101-like [Erigeron canadensis]
MIKSTRNTGSSYVVPLGLLCYLVFFHACVAQILPLQSQSQSSSRSKCQIDRITAREPNRQVTSEAGVSEFWDSFENDELECAGVEVVRHTIYSKGLLLPYYSNAPELVYVVQGQGIQGTVLPGCPETFSTMVETKGDEQFFDTHQRVYRYNEGDILALPAGAVHWTYNDGNSPLVAIVLRDTNNVANQLDNNFRKFFLAGNPSRQPPQSGPRFQPGQPGFQPGQQPAFQPGKQSRQQPGFQPGQSQGQRGFQPGQWPGQLEGFNVFSGFDFQMLMEVFGVEYNTVEKLTGQNDNRGSIVMAENFEIAIPEDQYQDNGIEQTICSTKFSANIASPARADVYNPRGGRISSLNSHKLPILNLLKLSAERGVLYKNAVLAPHYNLNAHSIIYVISGGSRLQIVGNDGSLVFDDMVQKGQLIVVPQAFAVIKKAGEEGCEWVAFKTNDDAITTQLAGRFSYVREVPIEVLSNSYDISREQAKKLKYNRQEGVVLSPRSGTSMEKAKNVLLNTLFG